MGKLCLNIVTWAQEPWWHDKITFAWYLASVTWEYESSSRTSGEGTTSSEFACSCCPPAIQVILAGGLLIEHSQVSLMTSPALAFWWPLMVTFSGATEGWNQQELKSEKQRQVISKIRMTHSEPPAGFPLWGVQEWLHWRPHIGNERCYQ